MTEIATEEKIKEAARTIFMKKGFAATRTRDIAEEAGINLALLNYYFRSKQKLFEIIMQEKLSIYFGTIIPLMFDEKSTLEKKIQMIVNHYTDLLTENPDLPIFVLNEIKVNPEKFVKIIANAEFLTSSAFARQLKQKNPQVQLEHFFINILAMCIFPFIMKPAMLIITKKDKAGFEKLMMERRTLIPKWINAMLKVNNVSK